jgi:hypothetical protein
MNCLKERLLALLVHLAQALEDLGQEAPRLPGGEQVDVAAREGIGLLRQGLREGEALGHVLVQLSDHLLQGLPGRLPLQRLEARVERTAGLEQQRQALGEEHALPPADASAAAAQCLTERYPLPGGPDGSLRALDLDGHGSLRR